jgi:hypothetical protein
MTTPRNEDHEGRRVMTVRIFNTGRLYDHRGQLIGWQRLTATRVAFADVSRNIDGFVTLGKMVAEDGSTREIEAAILHAYDRNDYEQATTTAEFDQIVALASLTVDIWNIEQEKVE